STTWLPMNPAPPVTKTFLISSPSNLSVMVDLRFDVSRLHVAKHRADGGRHRLAGVPRARPPEAADLPGIELVDRYIGLPAACAPSELVLDALEFHPPDHDVCDLAHGEAVIGADVDDVVAGGLDALHEPERRQDVVDMDVGFGLPAVAEDLESL